MILPLVPGYACHVDVVVRHNFQRWCKGVLVDQRGAVVVVAFEEERVEGVYEPVAEKG